MFNNNHSNNNKVSTIKGPLVDIRRKDRDTINTAKMKLFREEDSKEM